MDPANRTSADVPARPAIAPSGPGLTTRQTRAQWAFAVFSVLNAVVIFPGENAILPLIQSLGFAGYLLGAGITAYCALCFGTSRARGISIVFHLLFIPVQFLFSFPGPLPLAGMVFSAVILGLLRPTFPRLSPGKRKLWVMLHVGLSVSWLGIAISMVVLSTVGYATENAELRHGAYELMHIFDLFIVIPTMMLSIITGLVVSLGSKWGLAKHWWVLLKLVIALGIPAVAIVESQWVQELAERTLDPAAEPGATGLTLMICMIVFSAALWTATYLSVFKPGGKTRWGKKNIERERAIRAGRSAAPTAERAAGQRVGGPEYDAAEHYRGGKN
ncbi:hypothetical protein LCL61_28945 [Amycolatopsis coloradensis]|uniref:Uncharacterized protein n=1 Tax=Amycolatopsis coloradensis TaxID=76021 RepID=A0ACD5BJF7_9PSEU